MTSEQLQCTGEAGARTCQPLVKAGGECRGNSQGCVTGTFCNWETLLCEPQRTSGACDGLQDICGATTICDPDKRECVEVGSPGGSACHSDVDCVSQYCNPAGVCQNRPGEESCSVPKL